MSIICIELTCYIADTFGNIEKQKDEERRNRKISQVVRIDFGTQQVTL